MGTSKAQAWTQGTTKDPGPPTLTLQTHRAPSYKPSAFPC